MQSLKEKVIRSHIGTNYPDARIVSWDEPESGLRFYTGEELAEVDGDWFPLSSHLKDDKVVYGGRERVIHTYTEGETGAGKTSRFVMQSMRALACMKVKPSFLVVDIHGEIVENLYQHLRDMGYAVKILNCDDPDHSDTYNPFAPLVKRCLETGKMDTEVLNQIRRISEIMQPVENSDDPIWDQGARSYTNGLILDKFEDLLAGDIPPDCITLYNIIQNHYWLRENLNKNLSGFNASVELRKLPHYQKKGSSALSVQKMIAVTDNAEKTRRSYYGVVENHFDVFGQPALYKLSSNSTIDIEAFIEQPTAIFIQSGATRIGDDLISLLVNEIYSTVVRLGKQSKTKMLPRKIHCFLDEFANSNIADGPEFIRMLTTSRKFGMYWHMLLQCDAQLDRKFDKDMARIIRANCTELFMGSHDYDTMVRFAHSCGQKTVESLPSQVSSGAPALEVVDLITADRLSLTGEGCLYVKSNRNHLLHTYIEAFYKCPEFKIMEDIRSVYPVNTFDYTDTAFFPDDIPPRLTKEEYQLLRFLHEEGPRDVFFVRESLVELDVDKLQKRLEERKLIHENTDMELLISDASEEMMSMFAKQHPNVPMPLLVPRLDDDYYKLLAYIHHNPWVTYSDLQAAFPDCDVEYMMIDFNNFNFIQESPEKDACATNFTDEYLEKLEKNRRRDAFEDIPGIGEKRILLGLRDQVKAYVEGLTEELDLSMLDALTCVPASLHFAVRFFAGLEEMNEESLINFPEHILKFEIMESFIGANSFATKQGWVQAMRRELNLVRQLPYLTQEVITMFQNAYNELDKDLTLGNIQEIKKIISGSTGTE